MTSNITSVNNFAVLDTESQDNKDITNLESTLKSLDFTNVDSDNTPIRKNTGNEHMPVRKLLPNKTEVTDGFQLVERRPRKPRPQNAELHDFEKDSFDSSEIKLVNIVNNVSHYLELANEAINCMCSKALRNIESRQDKITSGTWSMNILGPMFRNDFYVRLDSKKYAFVKESVVKSGKLELDGESYNLNIQDTIRLWDVLCGPTDRPTLFRENNMLSLGEKLQKIIQEKVHQDLITDGKLGVNEPYKPTVWLFLAYRYNYNDQKEAARFINMCWNSDGEPPKSLIRVAEYCDRVNNRGSDVKKHEPTHTSFNKFKTNNNRYKGQSSVRAYKNNS